MKKISFKDFLLGTSLCTATLLSTPSLYAGHGPETSSSDVEEAKKTPVLTASAAKSSKVRFATPVNEEATEARSLEAQAAYPKSTPSPQANQESFNVTFKGSDFHISTKALRTWVGPIIEEKHADLNSWDIAEAHILKSGKTPAEIDSLTFEDTRLQNIPNWIFDKMPHIKTLVFRNPYFGRLPTPTLCVHSDHYFRHYDGVKVSMGMIPPRIKELTQLEVLDMSHCGIRSADEALTQLPNLKTLRLANNAIKKMPDLSLLVSLNELDLSHNFLEDLCLGEKYKPSFGWTPRESKPVANLPNLHALNVSHNKFVTLPQGVGNCVQLEMLNVSYNDLEGYCLTNIKNLLKLKELRIGGNNVLSLDKDIVELPLLHTLRIERMKTGRLKNPLGVEATGTLGGMEIRQYFYKNDHYIDENGKKVRKNVFG